MTLILFIKNICIQVGLGNTCTQFGKFKHARKLTPNEKWYTSMYNKTHERGRYISMIQYSFTSIQIVLHNTKNYASHLILKICLVGG